MKVLKKKLLAKVCKTEYVLNWFVILNIVFMFKSVLLLLFLFVTNCSKVLLELFEFKVFLFNIKLYSF